MESMDSITTHERRRRPASPRSASLIIARDGMSSLVRMCETCVCTVRGETHSCAAICGSRRSPRARPRCSAIRSNMPPRISSLDSGSSGPCRTYASSSTTSADRASRDRRRRRHRHGLARRGRRHRLKFRRHAATRLRCGRPKAHVLLGSSASKIPRHVPVSIMIVPRPRGETTAGRRDWSWPTISGPPDALCVGVGPCRQVGPARSLYSDKRKSQVD